MMRIRSLPRRSSSNASEPGPELAWCAILLLASLISITSPVLVAFARVPARRPVRAIATTNTARAGRDGLDRLLVCRGNNLGGEVEFLAEVVEACGSQRVVVECPGELRLDVALGRQRLHGLDNLEVGHGKVLMFGEVVVLLRDENALLEEVLVDEAPIFFTDEHDQ